MSYIIHGTNNMMDADFHISDRRLLIFRSSLNAATTSNCPWSTILLMARFSNEVERPLSGRKTDSITCKDVSETEHT